MAAEVRRVAAPSLAAGPGKPHYLPWSLEGRTRGSGPLTVFCLPGSPLRHAPLSAGSDSEATHHSLAAPRSSDGQLQSARSQGVAAT